MSTNQFDIVIFLISREGKEAQLGFRALASEWPKEKNNHTHPDQSCLINITVEGGGIILPPSPAILINLMEAKRWDPQITDMAYWECPENTGTKLTLRGS